MVKRDMRSEKEIKEMMDTLLEQADLYDFPQTAELLGAIKFARWVLELEEIDERKLCDREHGCGGITCKECDELNKCKTCFGYGLHALGDPSPMGPMDAKDGMPTKPCPECGANYNGSD